MKNENLIQLIPEEDLAVDGNAIDINGDSNVKVEVMGTGDNIVTEEDKAEEREDFFDDFEKAANLGILSPVAGMGKITGILDDRLYARIIENENGERYLEFCEQYENGKFSPRFKVAQDDLIIASRCGFQPQTITKKSDLSFIKSDVMKFMNSLNREYCRKYNGNHMFSLIEILTGLCQAYPQLPVDKEDMESIAGRFYDELVERINELMFTHCCPEHKSYYVILPEDIDFVAKKFNMKRLEFLKLLKRYNLLYLTPSSRGYQTNIRFRKDKPNGLGPEWNYTAWVYCIYNLKYLNSLKEEQTGKKADKEQEPEIYPEL